MTSGAKLAFGLMVPNRQSSATNIVFNDKARLQLCYFAPLLKLWSEILRAELCRLESDHELRNAAHRMGFTRIGSVTRNYQKRTRDREPSRIPVHRVPKVLKRMSVRQKMEQEVETTYKSAFLRIPLFALVALIKTLRDI